MPTPSSSYEGITPLPPSVVAIRAGIFQPPDEPGVSISVPTDYKLYTSSDAPSGGVGQNGDWYQYVTSTSVKVYRKIVGTWTLVSTISGGGGGGGGGGAGGTYSDIVVEGASTWTGGTINAVTITNASAFNGGTISGVAQTSSTLTGNTIVGGTETNTAHTGGTFATPTITSPTITGTVAGNPTITAPVVNGGTITGANIVGGTITGLSNPTSATEAATKQYVDAAAQGLFTHTPGVAATTGNVTLAGGAPKMLDGVTLVAADRILVKDQTDAKQNGIYVVATLGTGSNGTWTRATDADTGTELNTGSYIFITSGTINSQSAWVMTQTGSITIGVTDIIWTLFSQIDGGGIGPAGPAGPPGAPGTPGTPGTNGTNGANGTNGINGLDGATTFYGPSSSPPTALRAGDIWFVTDLSFEMRRATNPGAGNWVPALLGAAAFDTISGTTYIKRAAIREVDAGVIITGSLTAALTIASLGSITSGSGTAAVVMNTSGLSAAGGRVNMYGDGTNPWVRVGGVGGYGSSFITMNGGSAFTGPFFQVSGGASLTQITPAAGITVSGGGGIMVGDSSTMQAVSGTNGGINLFGGNSSALNIACGEDPYTGDTPDGYMKLKVNGRSVYVPFVNV